MKFKKLIGLFLLCFSTVKATTIGDAPLFQGVPGLPNQFYEITLNDYNHLTQEQKEVYKILPPLSETIQKKRELLECKDEVMPQAEIDIEKVKIQAKSFFKETLDETNMGKYLYSVAESMIDNGNYIYNAKCGGEWGLKITKEDFPPFDYPDHINMIDPKAFIKHTKDLIEQIAFTKPDIEDDEYNQMIDLIERDREQSETPCSKEHVNEWVEKIRSKFKNPFLSQINVYYPSEIFLFNTICHETGHAIDYACELKFQKDHKFSELLPIYFEIKSRFYASNLVVFKKSKTLFYEYISRFQAYLIHDFREVFGKKFVYEYDSKLLELFDKLERDSSILLKLTDVDDSENCYKNEKAVSKKPDEEILFDEESKKIKDAQSHVFYESFEMAFSKKYGKYMYISGFINTFEMLEANTLIEDVIQKLVCEEPQEIKKEGFQKAIDYLKRMPE